MNQKITFTFLVGILIFSSRTYAADDCSVAGVTTAAYTDIIPKDVQAQIGKNLRSYCCNKTILTDPKDCENLSTSYVESQYIFDHIFDMIMRRLDARTEGVNGEDLLYGLAADPSGTARREEINTLANQKEGTSPLVIEQTFLKYRGIPDRPVLPYGMENGGNADEIIRDADVYLGKVNTATYANRRLITKYAYACEISLAFTKMYRGNIPNSLSVAALMNTCEQKETARMQQEINYVQATLLQKSNKFLYDSIHSYLNGYFITNALATLQTKATDMANALMQVVNKIPRLIAECRK